MGGVVTAGGAVCAVGGLVGPKGRSATGERSVLMASGAERGPESAMPDSGKTVWESGRREEVRGGISSTRG